MAFESAYEVLINGGFGCAIFSNKPRYTENKTKDATANIARIQLGVLTEESCYYAAEVLSLPKDA